ncbi:hypothetical protein A6A22_10550 [Arthrobacter sp. OY3WO11]|nr:hypothetical protein A6A22_10550 [Arthrobacter sp. OY3WO11]
MRILIGSSSPQSIHALVTSSDAEKASWLTGIALVPQTPGQITLSTDADMLGSASWRLDSLSLMKVLSTAGHPLEVPSGPTGKTTQFQGRASIRAWEIAGSLHVDLELPHLVAGNQDGASASWEEVGLDAHILLADTHVMGRAEMLISFLRVRYT